MILSFAHFANLPASTKLLIFDTETTGLYDWRADPSAPHQPRVVQLGAILVTLGAPAAEPICSLNTLIAPDGWTIPEAATAVHGITTADCRLRGIHGATALQLFIAMLLAADVAVAFNLDYDVNLIGVEGHRHNRPHIFQEAHCFCAMRAATPLCRLPGKRPGDYKFPKLAEAHQLLVGAPLEGAHDALADVRGTRRLLHALIHHHHVRNPQPTATAPAAVAQGE